MSNTNSSKPLKQLYLFRWFIIMALIIGSVMVFYDLTGRRMFSGSSGEQWESKGPGYHK